MELAHLLLALEELLGQLGKPLFFVFADGFGLFVDLLLALLKLLALCLEVHEPVAQHLDFVLTSLLIALDLLVVADVQQEVVVLLKAQLLGLVLVEVHATFIDVDLLLVNL